VCDGAERSEFAKTLLMLGQATGAAMFSPLADRYGRKPCNVIARILYFVTALTTVFTPNIAAFSAFRFLQGTFQGVSSLSYSYKLHIAIIMKRKFKVPSHLSSPPVFSWVHATR
jgi:MFS family permease